jgi:2'-5' RNA ligase
MSKRTPVHRRANSVRGRLRRLYDQLWSSAFGRIRAGKVDVDPILKAGVPDRRRGLTVIARPSAGNRRSVAVFLRELRRLEPDQYYYTPSEFHLTVLSLFTATTDYKVLFAEKKRYIAAVNVALSGAAPIRITFEGITASPGAVMVQGFFEVNQLGRLRDSLRRQLRLYGLETGIDERYRLQTAHMTVVRFRVPLRSKERFAKALEGARQRAFGGMTIASFSLVENDWYMSRRNTVTLKRYSCTPPIQRG